MHSVAFSEWLRPWAAAGITSFLAEHPVDMTQLAPEFIPTGHHQPMGRPPVLPSPTASQNAQKQVFAGSPASSADTGSANTSVSPHSRLQASRQAHTQASHHSAAYKGQQASPYTLKEGELVTPLPQAEWPASFQEYFKRVHPSPVLWCYEALGEDLLGTSEPKRSACLKQLIGELRFPRGTSVFWPPSVPGSHDTACNQGVLLGAINELAPKLIIVLGAGDIVSCFYNKSRPAHFTPRFYKGHMVVFLPDFSELIDNTSLFNQSVLYLRAIVSQLSII